MKQKTKNSLKPLRDYLLDLPVISILCLYDKDYYNYNLIKAEYHKTVSKVYTILAKNGYKGTL